MKTTFEHRNIIAAVKMLGYAETLLAEALDYNDRLPGFQATPIFCHKDRLKQIDTALCELWLELRNLLDIHIEVEEE